VWIRFIWFRTGISGGLFWTQKEIPLPQMEKLLSSWATSFSWTPLHGFNSNNPLFVKNAISYSGPYSNLLKVGYSARHRILRMIRELWTFSFLQIAEAARVLGWENETIAIDILMRLQSPHCYRPSNYSFHYRVFALEMKCHSTFILPYE
jgi:hypothetical protein